MKAYGVGRKDQNCCNGHNKYPSNKLGRVGNAARKQRPAKKRARQDARRAGDEDRA